VGVYICHCGGNISDYVDVEELARRAAGLPGVTTARLNLFMCSDPGQELIIQDLRDGLVDRVVVASCSPSLHETTFRNALIRAGLNPYLYVQVNIREQVSWVSHGEAATDKAAALTAAGVAKARLIATLDPIRVHALDRAAVIGGGVAGLKAALDLARHGLGVTLVEKTPFLGGFSARLGRLFPANQRAGDLLAPLVDQVLSHPRVEVLACSEVTAQEGYIGAFKLTIRRRPPESPEDLAQLALMRRAGLSHGQFTPFAGVCPGEPPAREETLNLEVGAVLMATGFSPYEPRRDQYGYGSNPEVMTLAELIRELERDQDGQGVLKIGGRPIKSLAMIHCVGSREVPGAVPPDEEGKYHQYCSRVCCTSLLHAALGIRRKYPETAVLDVYRDIRTYGRGHEDIYREAAENGVIFMRFSAENPPVVLRSDNGCALSVMVRDQLMGGEELELPVDLVVLGAGLRPGRIDNLIDVMKCFTGPDGFLQEVHPKIRPVETAAPGVFLAGSCQAPMDMSEATSAASAAAAKAAAVLSGDEVELEPYVSSVDRGKCKACLTCVRTCPYGIPKIAAGKAHIEAAACYGCGACVGECPGKAISLSNFNDVHILAMEQAATMSQPRSKEAQA
jgi:heterodisulfide reductase subunit A